MKKLTHIYHLRSKLKVIAVEYLYPTETQFTSANGDPIWILWNRFWKSAHDVARWLIRLGNTEIKRKPTIYRYEPKAKAAQPPSVEVVCCRVVGDRKRRLMAGAAWRDVSPRIPRSSAFHRQSLAQRSKNVLSMDLKYDPVAWNAF